MRKLWSFLLVLMLVTASCGIMKPRNAVVITDHEEMMAILQEHFPDLYQLHEEERIEVDEIYFYKDREGRPQYKVSLRYLPPHSH
jgi:hypothetical protein